MGNKLRLTTLLFIVFLTIGKAQIGYQKTDSISTALYNSAEWQNLIDFGDNAILNGDDFPELRLKLAYAFFVRGNYGAALIHYDRVLNDDPYNQTGLYYAYLCNVYLNQPYSAGFLASRLENKTVEAIKVKSFKLITAGIESGLKFTNVFERGNSSYSRAFIDMRLAYKLSLTQSFDYFNQPIHNDNIEQPGYYAKINYSPFRKFSFIGAYHYMRSNLRSSIYQSNTYLLGINYSAGYNNLQGDVILSHLGNEQTKQYNVKFLRYISGNLNFYSSTRLTLMDVVEEKEMVFQQLFGIKPIPNLWFEGVVTLGNQYNYAETDALYIYNGFDKTKFKLGGNCYFLLKQRLLLGLNYTFERKSDNIFKFNYLQHSINGGITWSF